MLIRISRRDLLFTASAAPLLAQLQTTPMQTLGPFYPANHLDDVDADLTQVKGRSARAKGDLLYVTGRVMNTKGEPVRGAKLEIWQCNAAGKYRHGADDNPAPIDPNFQGFAVIESDKDGYYRFKTIKPGAYPIGKNAWRTPHIHFEVTGKESRITTQLYFPGEALNEKDTIFKETRRREALVAKILPPEKKMEAESKIAAWDIVLNRG